MQLSDSEQCVGRKQSASDLQSRLKTRKLLGVGELVGDNGDIYRSKISQLLGINESLYVRLPRGLLLWNTAITMYIYMIGIVCLVTPSIGSYIEFGYSTASSEQLAVRMYGAAMFAFGLLFRGLLVLKDARSEISTLLLACATLFSLQLTVGLLHGHLSYALAGFRMAGIIGSLVYQSLLDTQGSVCRQVLRYFDETFRHSDHSPSRSSSSDEKEKTS
uniref:Tumor protein p53-inducible protein 11 n=1 Tax=Parascaris univalens TaxID=6257 RepID=A0A915BB07_PARUN